MTAGDRQRRYRYRQKAGAIVAPIELRLEVWEMLIDLGILGADEDPRKGSLALADFLERALRVEWNRKPGIR